MSTDKGKSLIASSSQRKRSNRSNRGNTPLTIPQRLIFFENDRTQLAQDILENLPSELYDKIVQIPSTAETQLIHRINQLCHIFPEDSLRVIQPKISSLRLLLNPSTPRSQKIWTIENGLCYGLVSDSYRDRIHLFPTLTTASLKLKGLCSDKLYFKFYSTPPIWVNEEYEPAQHIVFITEYYSWWRSSDDQFLTTPGAEYYNPEHHPMPPEISRMNLRIDQVFAQLHMQHIMETFPQGFHIFHHSPNWIFATNVQGILKSLVPRFSGNFIHEPHWPTVPWQ